MDSSKDYQYSDINNNGMTTADWRWAAVKGFWDPLRRCWNEDIGGKDAYIAQRNQRRAKRKVLQRATAPTIHNSDRECCSVGHFYGPAVSLKRTRYDLSQPVPIPTYPAAPSLLSQTLGNFWPHSVCRRYWSLGYQAEPILQIFHHIPTELRDSIGETLGAIQEYADAYCRYAPCATRASLLCPVEVLDAEHSAFGAECGGRAGPWEHDAVHAFIRIDFAPTTLERIAYDANSRAAEMLGMRREELLARYEQHAVPLALPPLDAVCSFLLSLRSAYDEVTTQYARVLIPGGAALVRISRVKTYDTLRRLRQVRWGHLLLPLPAVHAVDARSRALK
jgi:hypothetical protein